MRTAIVRRAWLLLVCAPSVAWAGLNVIADAGPSVPVAPYLGHLLSGQNQPGVLPGVRFPLITHLKADPEMAAQEAGAITSPVFNPAWVVQPIFVLGTDANSLRWLHHHRPALIAQGATGVVVHATSERDFKTLQSTATELTLIPAVGPWLEQTLLAAGVKHYPIWIDAQGRVHPTPASSHKVLP